MASGGRDVAIRYKDATRRSVNARQRRRRGCLLAREQYQYDNIKMAGSRGRKEASGSRWKEQFVDHESASNACSVELSISNAWSIVVMDNFATIMECNTMMTSLASLQQTGSEDHVMGASLVNTNCKRYPIAKLDASANEVHQAWFQRLLGILERDLFGLFNTKRLAEQDYTWYMEPDENGVMEAEPKVNLYTKGGLFCKHVDGMQLTIFVMLNDSYSGSGTAFYQGEEDAHPSVVRPDVGTAMIWGGSLLHSALPTTGGMRAVFVGSFALAPQKRTSAPLVE